MSIEQPAANPTPTPGTPRRFAAPGRRTFAVGALLATLIVGAGAGALATTVMHPRDQQTLLPPVAISAMKDDSLVAVRGQVAEIFGNKVIISDPTGRALVDLGRSGKDGKLVSQGEEVTAQGRFDDGFVHASMVVHADGKVDELRGPPGPPHGHGPKWRDWMRDQGPKGDGSDAGPVGGLPPAPQG